jgi:hypothetical protein
MLDQLRALLGIGRDDPRDTELIYVYLPEAIEPDERHARYENVLDAELRLHSLGFVSGGGTLLSDERDDGSRDVLSVGVDVDAVDVTAARSLLRDELPSLGCPAGTELHYREGGVPLQDAYDGAAWHLAQPGMPDDDED